MIISFEATGARFVDGIDNILGSEIVDYFPTNIGDYEVVVHRFFLTDIGSHFYTTNNKEKQFVIDKLPQYTYEGESFKSADISDVSDPLSGAKPVYRFLNVDTGAHLYTIDSREKDFILNNLDNYTFEDVAYHAYYSPKKTLVNFIVFIKRLAVSTSILLQHQKRIISSKTHFIIKYKETSGVAFYGQPIEGF